MADALYSTVEAVNHARFASGAIAIPIKTSRGQSFVHLDDVVDALRATVARRATLRHEASILIGESEPFSYDELQRLLAGHIHGDADWDTTQIPKAVAKAGAWVQDQIPSIEEPCIKPWMIDPGTQLFRIRAERE